jgi:glycosyltransferase involved in cell wall biosynthesis
MSKIASKPRVALFAKGVIAGGNLGYGIPVLKELFDRLSADFEIVLYSFSSMNEAKALHDIQVRQINFPFPARIKGFLLAVCFVIDHIFRGYNAMFAVSVYPAGYWALKLSHLFKLPTIVQIIGLEAVAMKDIGCGNLLHPKLKRITEEVCIQATVLIAVAEYQKLVALHSLPTSRKIDVLPLRVNYERFQYQKRQIDFPVKFLHIAYYSPIKDQDMMFSTFARISQMMKAELKVIGDGYNIPRVREMLKRLNIEDKVIFTGEIDQFEIPCHFKSSHILFHTARFETGCAVIQEAMASGVAVCGTRVGILADIGDDFAVIVPVGDDEQLAVRTLQLIHDPAWYDRITTNAYQWITTYDSVWSYNNYKNFLSKIIAKD